MPTKGYIQFEINLATDAGQRLLLTSLIDSQRKEKASIYLFFQVGDRESFAGKERND